MKAIVKKGWTLKGTPKIISVMPIPEEEGWYIEKKTRVKWYRTWLSFPRKRKKQAAQQPPAQTVCSNCICEYCKFAKDTETDCGKECGNHFEAFDGRKLFEKP